MAGGRYQTNADTGKRERRSLHFRLTYIRRVDDPCYSFNSTLLAQP